MTNIEIIEVEQIDKPSGEEELFVRWTLEGKNRKSSFHGHEYWLEEVNGEKRFITRIKHEANDILKRHELSKNGKDIEPPKKIKKHKKFKGVKIEI